MNWKDGLTSEQARQLDRLHIASNDEDIPCRNAPVIWDGETAEDRQMAKRGCLGKDGGRSCPILNLCAETAMVINVTDGVWGGLTPSDRRKMRYRR